jgi:iron complex outermembrane receptor protein
MGDDSDGGALIELDTRFTDDIHSLTQEIRLSSPADSLLSWVGGLYYSDDTIKGDILQALDQHIFHTRVDTNWIQGTRSYAGFGQIEWPFARRWSVIAGARFTREKKDIVYNSMDLNPFGDSTLPVPVAGIDNTIDKTNVSGKLGLNYHLTDSTLLYTSASKGFKSGGFKAAIAFNPAELAPFDPETLYAYEVGFKSTLADGTLRLNAAGYFYDYRNFQAYITENREGINVVVLSNAGNARIKGAEAQIVWSPIKGLDLSTGANIDAAQIVKYNSLPGTADFTGHELANSPRRTLIGTARYELPLGDSGLRAYILGDANYQSGQYFSVNNNPQAYQSGYTLINARVGLTGGEGRWEVSGWIRNLANRLYVSQAYDNYPGIFPSSWFYGDPRTYGLSVQYRLR